MKVVLRRGEKGNLEWDHPDRKSAWRRASALADLHSVRIYEDQDKFVVDAAEWYGGKR